MGSVKADEIASSGPGLMRDIFIQPVQISPRSGNRAGSGHGWGFVFDCLDGRRLHRIMKWGTIFRKSATRLKARVRVWTNRREMIGMCHTIMKRGSVRVASRTISRKSWNSGGIRVRTRLRDG